MGTSEDQGRPGIGVHEEEAQSVCHVTKMDSSRKVRSVMMGMMVGPELWNSVPISIQISLPSFKRELSNHIINNYS